MASPRFASSSANLWDPWTEFEILNSHCGNKFTCLGQTRKMERCRNPIGVLGRKEVGTILRRLAVQEPSAAEMNDDLEELAESSCCGQWRHLHAPGAAARLKQVVANLERTRRDSRRPAFRPGPRAPRARTDDSNGFSTSADSAQWHFRSARPPNTSSAPPRATRPSRNSTASPSPTVDAADTIAELLQTIQDMRNDHFVQMRRLSRERSESAARVRQLVRERDELEDEVESLREQIADMNTSWDTYSELSDADSDADSEPAEQECSERHVARRLIDADCGICLESMIESPANELVWCKKQCGKSVHKECFDTWRVGQGASPRCVHCRSEWSGSCAHDDILPHE